MTPLDALLELLERVGASRGAAALVSEDELSRWPAEAMRELKAKKLLQTASPAVSVVCPGCEQECVMPVHTPPAETGAAASFVVCDKRDDINRVAVSAERVRQWRAPAASIADLITGLLGLRSPDAGAISSGRWEIGMLKGRKHSSHIVLISDGQLTLCVAGHTVALADVLTLEGDSFKLDKQTLMAQLREQLLSWKEQLLPKHPMAEAVNYALSQWTELNVFCSDGAVSIDNNVSEREMKRVVLNRKNSLFVGNPRGGRTAAILASLTSTCRRHDIDPQLYLTQLLTNLSQALVSG
jgi:Transposase IS66 family